MKKLFALALVVLGLAACQTEPNELDVNVGGEVTTTVNISIPETTRATNSAEGAFKNVDLGTEDDNKTIRYILQVYYKGEPSDERLVKYSDGKSVAFDVRLVSGRDYQFVAWADYVESKDDTDLHYNTENLKNVTLNRTWVAMDETRDAFTATKEVAYRSATAIDLTLKRPFAKLRIITTDMEALNNIGIEPTKATVEYDVDHYNAFNAFEGKAIADSKNRDIKHEKFAIKAYDDNVVDESKVLFTDYFFAENDVVKFYLTVFDQNGEVIGETIAFNTDINVKRNYVTTISGNILTDRNNVNVTVKDAFDNADSLEEEPYYKEIVEVGNAADLQEAINNSTEETMIVLGGDIVLGDEAIELAATRAAAEYALLVPAGKVVNLNLNGKTISHEKECTASYEMILNKGNLTITGNGKLSFKDTSAGDPTYGWGSYTLRNEGTLVVENGTIEHLGEQDAHMICAIFQYSGHSTINGGKISTPYYRSARLWSGDMTINGGEFEGQLWLQAVNDTSDLTINGGTFAPRGDDSSSVFVTNTGKAVKFAVNGGNFTTKIGMSVPFACITGGTFTTEAKESTNSALINDDYTWAEAENGNWKLVRKGDVAKIGEVGYTSLQKAVNAVQDGETITLVANETFTEKNYYNNGGWKDGLGYAGDKSFTIDLNNHTVSQNGALNDYLIWIKNVGSKANTITIKNGTLDAGTTAYCALCTASSHDNQLTINLENITLINKISNGSTVKVRAGSVVNVKAGTKITGKDSYLGIENWNATVNVYDGAEIYMNGTSSYNGCLIGVGGNGTVNVYGGYGKGVSGGLIAMTSGGTINVSGGEWIANTDGTYANSNKSVLIAQSDKQYNAGAGNAIVNVTGGTFKGGYNCYGNAVGDAQINIKGGNFNANPESYVVAGYESVEENGVWTVGKPKALADFEAAIANGGNVTLDGDITLLEAIKVENKTVVIDLNGKTVTAPLFSAFEVKNGAELTIKNGKVVAYESTVRAIGGKATIESGEYTSTGTALDSPSTYRYSLDCREGGELIINGGTFKSNNGMINVGSTVTINGGKFENIVEKTMTRHLAYVSAALTINGGEFYGKANSSAGGCFFCGAAASCDIQINGGKFTSLWTSGSVNRIFELYTAGGKIEVTGGLFNTNGGIKDFVTENTDEATKAAYPYVAK